MSDASTLILSFVDIIEDSCSGKALCGDVEVFHHFVIDEVISSTAIEKCVFGHFVFIEQEPDINAVLCITNIHGMYLPSLDWGRWSKLF